MIESNKERSGEAEEYLSSLLDEENELPRAEELQVKDEFKKLRIVGLLIVYNYAVLGPYTAFYYYSEKSGLAKKYAFNPASLAELSLVAKHTKILEGVTDTRGLIDNFKITDEFGRDTQGYILIEFKKRASIKKLKQFISEIKAILEKNQKTERLKEKLEKKIKDIVNELT